MTSNENTQKPKRVGKACDNCRLRRVKCDGNDVCSNCIELNKDCEYNSKSLKRGPKQGSNRRTKRQVRNTSTIDPKNLDDVLPCSPERAQQLFAIYFNCVHIIWPILHKSTLHIQNGSVNSSKALMRSILAIAACLEDTHSEEHDREANDLFLAAENALFETRLKPSVENTQTMIILAIRESGCGNKSSAWMYCGMACTMLIDMGLHCLGNCSIDGDNDIHKKSRVYWNCYLLNLMLVEETGHKLLLSIDDDVTTPLPSTLEEEEFASWPEITTSNTTLQNIPPKKSFTMSVFNSTCAFGIIVEKIIRFSASMNSTTSNKQIDLDAKRRERDYLYLELKNWCNIQPEHIKIVTGLETPLPHIIVNDSWYHSAIILLHRRFIKVNSSQLDESHQACTDAANNIVNNIAVLDKYSLLSQSCSDIIHILSNAAIMHAFNSTLTPISIKLANDSKIAFAQCCGWFKVLSRSWKKASLHKIFLESLIQGGLELSDSTSTKIDEDPSTFIHRRNTHLFDLHAFYWNSVIPSRNHPTTPSSTMMMDNNEMDDSEIYQIVMSFINGQQ